MSNENIKTSVNHEVAKYKTPDSAEELINRGELDIKDYKGMLITLFNYNDSKPHNPFSYDEDKFPRIVKERLAAERPIPREAYRAYIWVFGASGLQKLASSDSQSVELGYIPELAEEIGINDKDSSEELNRLMRPLHRGVEFNPKFQCAVARHGNEFSQYALLQLVGISQLDQRAIDTLRARGSRYAQGLNSRRAREQMDYIALQSACDYRLSLNKIIGNYREAVRSVWPSSDLDDLMYRSRRKQPKVSKLQWQSLFTFIEKADEARAMREQAIDELVTSRLAGSIHSDEAARANSTSEL